MRLLDESGWANSAVTWSAIEQWICTVEEKLCPAQPDESECYGWRPNSLVDLLAGLAICETKAPGRRLLELGSGIGRNLVITNALGWQVTGLEGYEPFARLSRKLAPKLIVKVGDAFAFQHYDEFDVVYYYRPLVDEAAQQELNRFVASRMRSGALLFASGGPDPNWLEPVGYQVWRV